MTDIRILYVCAHHPLPAVSGGQVDIWNRIQAFSRLGIAVDLLLTTKGPLEPEHEQTLRAAVRSLTLVPRKPLRTGLLSRLPVQVGVRSRLREIDLHGTQYDLVLLDNEFVGEVLRNPSLHASKIAIRVHNDEVAYQRRLADAESKPLLQRYHRMEARRMARYMPQLWQQAQALWFISSDELGNFRSRWQPAGRGPVPVPRGRFLPAGLDTGLGRRARPQLQSSQVLCVGSLAVTLNQDAIRWYLEHVHPLLLDEPGYRFVVAGSTLGKDLSAFTAFVRSHPQVEVLENVPDLTPLFHKSGAFVSPMRFGAGVKLKTVDAALRGLPLVSTTVGAEGSGLCDGVHCRIEDEPARFAAALRSVLRDRKEAVRLRDAAVDFICREYDQAAALQAALAEIGLAETTLPEPMPLQPALV